MSSRVEKKLAHYTAKAISDYKMIKHGDRVLVCLSGGKDSYTMLSLLHRLRIRSGNKFELMALTLDQAQPGWDDSAMRSWLDDKGYPYEIIRRDTYSIVKEKIPEGKTYCSLCSRLRRGSIYTYAKENGYTKIALGHHREDLIESLLMSIMYSGEIKSMPPKLLTNDKKHIVIRPMVYCQEKDIIAYANEKQFPIIPCNLCGSQENLTRVKMKTLIQELATQNPKVPANMLNALGNIRLSQLMDKDRWDFKALDSQLDHSSETLPIEKEPFDNSFVKNTENVIELSQFK